ncbi:MAG: hypothetical protein H0U97_12125 [Gammaproteobacteria bacterium]|nr:hypothetical protein [Gammaproteobacteria bacterium]
MFIGSVPREVVTQLLRVTHVRPGEVFVCCSGSFRVDLAVKATQPEARVLSNDVSLLSCALGAHLTGQALAFRFHGELAFLEEALAGRSYLAQIGGILVALDALKFNRKTEYGRRHFEHYHKHAGELLERAEASLAARFAEAGVDGFFPGDFRDHAKRAGDAGGLVIAFPPTYKCLAPQHRVLTADLRWTPCGDLVEGDWLVAFDEHPEPDMRCRRWRLATVTHSAPAQKWRGHQIEWIDADKLMERGRFVVRALNTWESLRTYETGWLAGMLDGEGSITLGQAAKLTFVQKPGAVLDRFVPRWNALASAVVQWRGVSTEAFGVLGGFPEIMRAIGILRPMRLIADLQAKFSDAPSIRSWAPEHAEVVSVESVGVSDVQAISTSTATYVGEGYLMHNCGYERLYRRLHDNVDVATPLGEGLG